MKRDGIGDSRGHDLALNMTIREKFAGLAMQNLQNVLLRKSGSDLLALLRDDLDLPTSEEIIAKSAVMQTDALLDALEKEK